tara:strand:+ start:5709 stop:6011 length:303 start_codon:yes stop_codon:yes gene_type:complete
MLAMVIAIVFAALIFIGGLFILAAFLDDWDNIRKFFEKSRDLKREKLKLEHERELEKMRLEHERETETWRYLDRDKQEAKFRELGLLDDEESEDRVENKA